MSKRIRLLLEQRKVEAEVISFHIDVTGYQGLHISVAWKCLSTAARTQFPPLIFSKIICFYNNKKECSKLDYIQERMTIMVEHLQPC